MSNIELFRVLFSYINFLIVSSKRCLAYLSVSSYTRWLCGCVDVDYHKDFRFSMGFWCIFEVTTLCLNNCVRNIISGNTQELCKRECKSGTFGDPLSVILSKFRISQIHLLEIYFMPVEKQFSVKTYIICA